MRRGLLAFAALIALILLWPAFDRAAATIGGSSGGAAGPALFVDATDWSGLGASQHTCPPGGDRQYFVTGQAWGDADGDGIADLYLTNQCGPSMLYRGLGNGQFEPAPLSGQVALAERQAGGAVFADFDNDGWQDLLVLTYDGPVLFHNDAGRGFRDVTAAAGLDAIEGAHPVSAGLADYDGDGALDIFIANYGCVACLPGPRDEVRSQLFHNRGDGRFEDVSELLGGDGPMGFSFVGGWGDFDNDGDPDLYVTNDVRGGRSLHGNGFYRNDGPGCGGWCFTDVSSSSGAGVRADAMGLAVADFNEDGRLDMVVTNSGWAYTALTGPSLVLTNQGDGTFRDSAEAMGAAVDAMAWGVAAPDVNNDGWPDLYFALGSDPAHVGVWATTNRLLVNDRGRAFRDVTRQGGAADVADSFGVAVGDANGDGQADLMVGDYNSGYRLFLGTGGGADSGNRLVVRLKGAAPVNRDAVGARIEVRLSDGRRIVHEVALGGTTGGNDDPAFRTGTGAASVVELLVRWPDGFSQIVKNVPNDSEVRLTYQEDPEPRALPAIGAYADPADETGPAATSIPLPIPVGLAAVGLAALAFAWLRRPTAGAAGGPGVASQAPSGLKTPGAPRSLRVGSHQYPVLLPSLRDPRLHLAAVISSLQVLGQTVLGFELSIAQILVSVLTCGVIEFVITFRRSRAIVWPASALLTGNGVAFILRIPGTEHGDWWSLNGWYIYAGVAAVSVLSKYAIRDGGRHVFNPSNFGLVLVFLLLGNSRVEPLDFWWGPISPGVTASLVIIAAGALAILTRLRLLGMAAAFWVTFAAGLSLVAAGGHCMSAKWSFDPVCGARFWTVLVTSPELLVFMFFMMTDPKTTPAGRVARVMFGSAVGVAAAVLIAPQQTEFSTKVALLVALTVVCAARPYLERLCPAAGSERDSLGAWIAGFRGRGDLTGAPSWGRAVRRWGVGVAVMSLWLFALIPLGVAARLPVVGVEAADALVSRPAVAVDTSTLPPVTIDPSFRRLDAGITDGRAAGMARDLAADLKIEALALRNADREVAKTAAAGARLEGLLNDIEAGRQTGQTMVPTYTFESMKLVPVYDGANAQAGPQVGIEVRGRVRRVPYEGTTAARPGGEEDSPFERTFALVLRQGVFLIAADYPPAQP